MLEGKLIIIPALGHQNKGKASFTGSGLLVLMSQCRNNNELALQHGGVCTTWSLVAKGLLGVLLQIIFCSCVIETTLLCENGGSVPRAGREWFDIFSWSKERWWSDKTSIELGYRKISAHWKMRWSNSCIIITRISTTYLTFNNFIYILVVRS